MIATRSLLPRRLISIRHLAARAAVGASMLIAAGPAIAQHCDDIGYRIWQPGGSETRYSLGDTVRLERGVEAHLYIHHASQVRNRPYSASAEIGYPSAVGLRAPTDDRVLALQAQAADDRRDGRIVFTTREAGRTALGYRIEAVSSPGIFDRLAEGCRRGIVTIEVVGTPPQAERPAADRQRAARSLAHTIEKALVPWKAASVDDDEMARVLATGRAGLVELAGQTLRTPAFRTDSYYAIIDGDAPLRAEADRDGDVDPERVAAAWLTGVYTSLYGGAAPLDRLHRANVEDLLGCVGDDGRAGAQQCDQLAERLLSNAAFQQTFRAELEALVR